MKLSTRGRYGIRALLELALRQNESPVLLRDIAESQQISLAYLEHLITPLVVNGVVRSTRGARGGISLARDPREIKMNEVFQILEGSTSPVDCIDNPDTCLRSGKCAVRDVWDEMKRAVDEVLESKTLQDLVEQQKSKEQLSPGMYYI